MMRIIVIDDEPRQRNGMQELIRTLRNSDEVCGFRNGDQALAYVREHPVDVVLSDIRMPGMTGLELARQMMIIHPEVIIILVSVYADFEYARKAIELGAFGYILKPVSVDAVCEILNRAAARIEERKKKQVSASQGMIQSALTVYQQHLFKKWICGKISRQEEQELKTFIPTEREGHIVYLCLQEREDSEHTEEIISNVTEWMKQYLRPAKVYCFADDRDENAVTAVVFLQSSEADFRMMTERFLRNMERESSGAISVMVGRRFGYGGDVQKAFEEIKKASSVLFYEAFGRIQYQEEWPVLRDQLDTGDAEQKNCVRSRALEENFDSAQEALELFFRFSIQEPMLRPDILLEVTALLFMQIVDGMSEFFSENEKDKLTRASIALKSCRTYEQLKRDSNALLRRLIEEYRRGKQKLSPVYQAMYYIEEHYMDDLSLNMLAEKYHYSPSYFSAVFKHVAGENLVSYINRIRIEKAMGYLSIDTMKISEIADRVGMKDYKYFNRIFKRKYGISVQEYRKQLRREEEDKCLN